MAANSNIWLPDESHPHRRTWMAFVANENIWSRRQIPLVKKDLATLARTIAQYEPVAMLVSDADYDEAKDLLKTDSTHFAIDLIKFKVDDLWLRDTGPIFVTNAEQERLAIDFNFNGWGNKQTHLHDRKVAQFIAKQSGARLQNTELVLEGGSIETDGQGTAIITKSSVLNDNRNPDWSQKQIEAELNRLLGLKKIIWLNGIKDKDITDGHVDFYARFARPGEVIVSRENYRPSYDYQVTRDNIKTLEQSHDANGNKLNLHIIDTPEDFKTRFGESDFAAGYLGYYVCNHAVIAQKFGDKIADNKAKETLTKLFPKRAIEQIAFDGIASGGGTIHCTTQQEFKL